MAKIAPLPVDFDLLELGNAITSLHGCLDDHRSEVATRFNGITASLEAVTRTAAAVEQRLDAADVVTKTYRARATHRATATNDALKRLGAKFETAISNQEALKGAMGLNGGARPVAMLTQWQLFRRATAYFTGVGAVVMVLAWLYGFMAAIWPSADNFLRHVQ